MLGDQYWRIEESAKDFIKAIDYASMKILCNTCHHRACRRAKRAVKPIMPDDMFPNYPRERYD